MEKIKKYKIQLIHPFDPSIDAYLFQRGIIAEANYFEEEIIVFTIIGQENLSDQLHYDAKEITELDISKKEQEQYAIIIQLGKVS